MFFTYICCFYNIFCSIKSYNCWIFYIILFYKNIIYFSYFIIKNLKIKILEEKHNIDEYEEIEYEDIEEEDNEEGKFVKPKVNIVLTTYYKGTALDSVNKKLEEYLDDAGTEESEINEI